MINKDVVYNRDTFILNRSNEFIILLDVILNSIELDLMSNSINVYYIDCNNNQNTL